MKRQRKGAIILLIATVLLLVMLEKYFSMSARRTSMARTVLRQWRSNNIVHDDYTNKQEQEKNKPDVEPSTIKPKEQKYVSRAKTQTRTNSSIVKQTDDIEAHFKRRKEMLQDACSRYSKRLTHPPACELDRAGPSFKYVKDSHILYCAIQKVGSTFWKRIMHVIGGWGTESNPVSIETKFADNIHGGYETLKSSTLQQMHEVFSMSNSLMFVRDPYTKLFSARLDKFYSPNPSYWSSLGPSIVKRERLTRESHTTQAKKCVSDISFKEFVNYTANAITSNPCFDGHFAPNYQHCLPCVMPFEYIGKYETFKEDTMYLLKKFNVSDKVRFDDFESDAALDAIKSSVSWLFSRKNNIKNCNVTFHCALFKLWNRLQCRGIISKKIVFPYNKTENVLNITKEEFAGIIAKANKDSDPEELKKNKIEALHQAFQTLPSILKKKIGTVFDIDFTMFGYDKRPSYFNDTNEITHKYFEECQ